jgi:dolichol-phosphate mannosyltransferase
MIYILIPAYNEAQNLPVLFDNIASILKPLSEKFVFVVVNDGSIDSTQTVLNQLKTTCSLEILTHIKNQGVRDSFYDGFQWILKNSLDAEDILITIEADNTSDYKMIPRMVGEIKQGVDLVLSSCYMQGGSVIGSNHFRKFISLLANKLILSLFHLKGIHTFSSFFRAMRVDVLRKSFDAWGDQLLSENGFVCVVEMLIKMNHLGIRIREVPSVLSCNLRKGQSKMKLIQTTLGYFKYFIKELCMGAKQRKKALERWRI